MAKSIPSTLPLYDIWKVTYGTYDDVARDGNVSQELLPIQVGYSYELGLKKVAELGFGYCLKPHHF